MEIALNLKTKLDIKAHLKTQTEAIWVIATKRMTEMQN